MEIIKKGFKNEILGIELDVYVINEKEWFKAQDISEHLEYRDRYNMTRSIDFVEDNSCTHNMRTVRGNEYEALFINEIALYECILKIRDSKTDEDKRRRFIKAREFQKWVFSNVLPSLRKNGYYLNENMSSEQYEKLQDELRIRNQQVDNFSNMIGGNTRKKQKLETFLKDMFPHIKDGYKQFLDSMVKAGSLDVNYNPTEVFIKINDKRHIFTHTINTTNMVDTYLSLTNIGMVEMSKRLYEENGKIKLRKSEDKK